MDQRKEIAALFDENVGEEKAIKDFILNGEKRFENALLVSAGFLANKDFNKDEKKELIKDTIYTNIITRTYTYYLFF